MTELEAIKNIQSWFFFFNEKEKPIAVVPTIFDKNGFLIKNTDGGVSLDLKNEEKDLSKFFNSKDGKLYRASFDKIYNDYIYEIEIEIDKAGLNKGYLESNQSEDELIKKELEEDFKSNDLKSKKEDEYKTSNIEDYAHEVFFELMYKQIYKWSPIGSFGGWINKCTKNWVINFKKKNTITDKRLKPDENSKLKIVKEIKYTAINDPKEQSISRYVKMFTDEGEEFLSTWDDDPAIKTEDKFDKEIIRDCVKNAIKKFINQKANDLLVRALILDCSGEKQKEIAKKINKTYGATKVFLSEGRKKFMPFVKPCFEYFLGNK